MFTLTFKTIGMLACLLATAIIGTATVWRRALAFNFFTRYARKSVEVGYALLQLFSKGYYVVNSDNF